jgi:hypothetical protein
VQFCQDGKKLRRCDPTACADVLSLPREGMMGESPANLITCQIIEHSHLRCKFPNPKHSLLQHQSPVHKLKLNRLRL